MKSAIILMLLAMMTIVHCGVIEATDEDFDNILKENPRTLVMFSAVWCGHCKKMFKVIKKLADSVEKSKDQDAKITIVRIDADKYKEIGNRPEYNVKGYPTFKYFDNGAIRPFEAHKLSAMITVLAYLRLPIFKAFESEEEFEKNKGDKSWVVFRGNQDSTLFRSIDKIADRRRTGSMAFGTILGEGKESLTIYRSFGGSHEYSGDDAEVKKIKFFLDIYTVPDVFDFNRETKGYQPKLDVPRLVITCENEEEKVQAESLLESVSEQASGVIQLCYSGDKRILGTTRRVTGLKSKAFIYQMGAKTDTIYKIDEPITFESLSKQLSMFKEGTLPRYFKTQPEMEESQQTPLRHVTYTSFEKEVMEKSQENDVVVMFYAKWCGACKHQKPILAEMAKEAVEKMPKLLMVKYDAEENHPVYSITGYPTVVLYQKGQAKKMSYFTRGMFIKFYERHGSFEWKEFDKEKKQRLAKKEKAEKKEAESVKRAEL